MKQHARKAYDELEAKGADLMDGLCYGSYFAVGTEPQDIRTDQLNAFDKGMHRMINTTIPKILKKHGLRSEWENGVIIGVYDN